MMPDIWHSVLHHVHALVRKLSESSACRSLWELCRRLWSRSMTRTLYGTGSTLRPSTPADGTATWLAACPASWQKALWALQVISYIHDWHVKTVDIVVWH